MTKSFFLCVIDFAEEESVYIVIFVLQFLISSSIVDFTFNFSGTVVLTESSMILSSAEAILASSTSKFGIEIPRVDDEDLNSSTELTNSTSWIHCIASVGNCEEVHTSVFNLIFQQAKVAGVGNLSKWRSEICSRCWSAP